MVKSIIKKTSIIYYFIVTVALKDLYFDENVRSYYTFKDSLAGLIISV